MNEIEEYIRKYCVKHEIDRETALTHRPVKDYIEFKENAEKGKNNASEWYAGCGCVVAEDKSC